MAIQGSVVAAPTVTTLTLTSETVTMPQANLTIVKVLHSAVYLSIPLSPARNAILPSAGGNTTNAATNGMQIAGTGRVVNFTVDGTALNYSVYSLSTTPTIVWYYGTPLANSQPLAVFTGVATTVTLSSGAGSGTLTFPAGNLNLVGVTATMGLVSGDGSGSIEITWNTSPGTVFNAVIVGNMVTQMASNEDILPLSMRVAQTLSITLSGGTTADKIVVYAYYSGTGQ